MTKKTKQMVVRCLCLLTEYILCWHMLPTMGSTVSVTLAVGRAVWTSASISSRAASGHACGENAHIAGGPSPSKGVDSPPDLAACTVNRVSDGPMQRFQSGAIPVPAFCIATI